MWWRTVITVIIIQIVCIKKSNYRVNHKKSEFKKYSNRHWGVRRGVHRVVSETRWCRKWKILHITTVLKDLKFKMQDHCSWFIK